MSEPASLEEWMNAAVASAEELATVALGFDGSGVIGPRNALSDNLTTAMIALVGDKSSVQLGMASSQDGCQQMARALLCMEPDEDDLPQDDVSDAIGEAVNIVAGQVKRIISGPDSTMKLGLPLIVHGRFESSDDVESSIMDMTIGPVPVSLLVLKSNNE